MSGDTVTAEELLDAIFPTEMLEDDDNVLVGAPRGGGWGVWPYSHRAMSEATHGVVSTFGDMVSPSNERMLSRSRANFKAAWVIQIDDIGTAEKSTPHLALRPSVMIETRPNNYTYLYILKEPITEWDRYVQITKSISADGIGDPNSTDATRFFRLPGSLPQGKEHEARLDRVNFTPDLLFDADTILDEMDVMERTLEDLRIGGGDVPPVPAPPGVIVIDPVLTWMEQRGMVQSMEPDGWFKIDCPWAHTHSDERNTAKFKPASEEDLRRVYWCWHTHGQEDGEWGEAHGIAAFLAWVEAEGGPPASPLMNVRDVGSLFEAMQAKPYDSPKPVPTETARDTMQEIMDRYVWFTPKGQIIDLEGDAVVCPNGRAWGVRQVGGAQGAQRDTSGQRHNGEHHHKLDRQG